MQIYLIAVGDKMPQWIQHGFQEYQKRFPKDCQLELMEISPKKLTSQLLMKKIPINCTLIAMDEHGDMWDTMILSKHIKNWKMSGKNVAILIGGADGLDKSILEKADNCWSLSKLTFPHMLVRVLVAEQLYRALTILSGHPYHRGD